MMKLYLAILTLILSLNSAFAKPAEIILLRHAEKPPDEMNVHLSARGKERAQSLAAFLTSTPALVTNGLPVALFATHPTSHGHGQRTSETLDPLATRLKLPIRTPYVAKDYAALARRILQDPALDGKTVVVCWVHDYLPALAEALGVSRPPAWKATVFDRVWVINYRDGQASLTVLPQQLLPGDSQHLREPDAR